MAKPESFQRLWAAFADESHHSVRVLGTEDSEAFEYVVGGLPMGAEIEERLRQRERIVTESLPHFADDDELLVAETLPLWCSCLATATLQTFSRNGHSTPFNDAIAKVLFSRAVRAAKWRLEQQYRVAGERRVLNAMEAEAVGPEVATKAESCGHEVREILRVQHARYTTLLMANTAPTANAPAVVSLRRTVIVHGTWAAGQDWWRDPAGAPPKSDSLWEFLRVGGAVGLVGAPDEFAWSGGNSDYDRRQGAADFVIWWQGLGQPELDVVAHSHGGNVVMLALAKEPALKVRRFVLLGTPARFDYVPRTKQTDELHNVYSEYDLVQIPGSYGAKRGEGRTQSDHVAATNRHLPYWDLNLWGVRATGHGDLHHPDFWANHRLLKLLA